MERLQVLENRVELRVAEFFGVSHHCPPARVTRHSTPVRVRLTLSTPRRKRISQLVTIYQHLDSTSATSALTPQGAPGRDFDVPSEWGRLMKSSRGGRTQVFERNFGNGRKVVTFVLWA